MPRSFKSNPDNATEKQEEYRAKLQAMPGPQLYEETKDKIWLSAYANNNPASCYHWQCDFTYEEWTRRGQATRYAHAHTAVSRG